jgi:diphosphomevalonate decarboxylase
MRQKTFVQEILADHPSVISDQLVSAYAPSNIALCKYWGKRDIELKLPETSSLSVSLADRGATTLLKLIDGDVDEIKLGENSIPHDTTFAKRLVSYLNLFRPEGKSFSVKTNSSIPIAAGLASSAAGFAALVLALNSLFEWKLDDRKLSLLARLGSGSACRSLWDGFVEWERGEREDGMDSFAKPVPGEWYDLRLGMLLKHVGPKSISSRQAMNICKTTSRYYGMWPEQVAHDLPLLKEAIRIHDFALLGQTAEENALAMHAAMINSQPPVLYWQPDTVEIMHKVWKLRADGVPVYFTEDAGPNIKLLFQAEYTDLIRVEFESVEIVSPFINEV